jgi:hypothetical protein
MSPLLICFAKKSVSGFLRDSRHTGTKIVSVASAASSPCRGVHVGGFDN